MRNETFTIWLLESDKLGFYFSLKIFNGVKILETAENLEQVDHIQKSNMGLSGIGIESSSKNRSIIKTVATSLNGNLLLVYSPPRSAYTVF